MKLTSKIEMFDNQSKVERSGSVGRALDWGSKGCEFELRRGWSHLAVSLRDTNRCLVLAQTRKTRLDMK